MFTYNSLSAIKDEVMARDELKIKREANEGDGAVFSVYSFKDGKECLVYNGLTYETVDFLNECFNWTEHE